MEDIKSLLLAVVIVSTLLLHSTHGFVIPSSSSTFNGTRSDSAASSSSAQHRKFLRDEPDRAWGDKKCSGSDIVINQGPTAPLPNGIPTYTVEIMNVCVTGCDISGIHLNCGWFSSARLINPRVFKRISFDDCLVNNGKRLTNGATVSFQYANTFPYRLSVSSVIC